MKQIFIIEDFLEKYSEIFKEIKKTEQFHIHLISYWDFISHRHREVLQGVTVNNYLVVIDCNIFEKHKVQLLEYLNNLYPNPIMNILKIYNFGPGLDIHTIDKSCFFFSETASPNEQATHFTIKLKILFDLIITTRRLNEYISEAFKETVISELLHQKNKEIKKLNKELEIKNKIDLLTKLYNRNALFDFLEKERKRTIRQAARLPKTIDRIKNRHGNLDGRISEFLKHYGIFSVMLIDIDNFKQVNDLYGHIIGDQVLVAFGELLLKSSILRKNDIASRFGGEEFLIILPGTDSNNAYEPALRILMDFRSILFQSKMNQSFNVTVSIGISQFRVEDKFNEEVIKRADKALYRAKAEGKNRIIIYETIDN